MATHRQPIMNPVSSAMDHLEEVAQFWLSGFGDKEIASPSTRGRGLRDGQRTQKNEQLGQQQNRQKSTTRQLCFTLAPVKTGTKKTKETSPSPSRGAAPSDPARNPPADTPKHQSPHELAPKKGRRGIFLETYTSFPFRIPDEKGPSDNESQKSRDGRQHTPLTPVSASASSAESSVRREPEDCPAADINAQHPHMIKNPRLQTSNKRRASHSEPPLEQQQREDGEKQSRTEDSEPQPQPQPQDDSSSSASPSADPLSSSGSGSEHGDLPEPSRTGHCDERQDGPVMAKDSHSHSAPGIFDDKLLGAIKTLFHDMSNITAKLAAAGIIPPAAPMQAADKDKEEKKGEIEEEKGLEAARERKEEGEEQKEEEEEEELIVESEEESEEDEDYEEDPDSGFRIVPSPTPSSDGYDSDFSTAEGYTFVGSRTKPKLRPSPPFTAAEKDFMDTYDAYLEPGTRIGDWPRLLVDLGLQGDFRTTAKCKKALRPVWVNIQQFLEAPSKPDGVRLLSSERELARDLMENYGAFPSESIPRGSPLRALLAKVERHQRQFTDTDTD